MTFAKTFKVAPTPTQIATLRQWNSELDWAYNRALWQLLQVHCVKYHEWMLKHWQRNVAGLLEIKPAKAKKLGIVPPDDIQLCQYNFSQKSPWVGFAVDDRELRNALTCRLDPETKKRVDVHPIELPKGTLAQKLLGLNGVATLNKIREEQGLPPLTVPSKYLAGRLAQLATAWKAYLDTSLPDRGKPRFKRGDNPISLYMFAPECLTVSRSGISGPGKKQIGEFRFVRDTQRGMIEGRSLTLVERGGEFHCSVTTKGVKPMRVKKTDKAIGIDLGVINQITTTNSFRVPERIDRLARKKEKLQAQMSAKLWQRAILWLNQPGRTKADVSAIVPISEESWAKLQGATTEQQITAALNPKRAQRFIHKLPKSKREEKLAQAIAKVSRKIAANRKAQDAWYMQHVLRNYAYIAIEDGTQDKELKKRIEPLQNADGTYEKNGREWQKQLNRRLAANTPGQKTAIAEWQAVRSGRIVRRTEPLNGTKECPVCGTVNETNLKTREYHCECCSWGHLEEVDIDLNAAINAELRAFEGDPDMELSEWAERARLRSYSWREKHEDALIPLWAQEKEGDPRKERAK